MHVFRILDTNINGNGKKLTYIIFDVEMAKLMIMVIAINFRL